MGRMPSLRFFLVSGDCFQDGVFLSLQIVMVIIVVRLAFRQTQLPKHASIYFVKCVCSLFGDKLSWSMGRPVQWGKLFRFHWRLATWGLPWTSHEALEGFRTDVAAVKSKEALRPSHSDIVWCHNLVDIWTHSCIPHRWLGGVHGKFKHSDLRSLRVYVLLIELSRLITRVAKWDLSNCSFICLIISMGRVWHLAYYEALLWLSCCDLSWRPVMVRI